MYEAHRYLLKSTRLEAEDLKEYKSLRELFRAGDTGRIEIAIQRLCRLVYLHYQILPVILVDEYDTPLLEAYTDGYWSEMIGTCRQLFHSTFKENPYYARTLITGVTKVSKNSLFSDLNNLETDTVTCDAYSDCFGFTEQEVMDALKCQNMDTMHDVKEMYDGFIFGKQKDMYNPWSICNYMRSGELQSYWINTSSNKLIGEIIRRHPVRSKHEIEQLMAGEIIHKEINENVTFQYLDGDENSLWSLFLAVGYIKAENVVKQGESTWCDMSVTNREVMGMFRYEILAMFENGNAVYNDFTKALLSHRMEDLNDILLDIAYTSMSYFDVGKCPPERTSENFYRGLVLGLIVSLRDQYRIVSNRESGKGFPDINTLEPLAKSLGISVLELMRSQKSDMKEKNLSENEVVELMGNAAEITKENQKQEKASVWIGGIVTIIIAILVKLSGLAVSIGGALFAGFMVSLVAISIYFFVENKEDKGSRKIYGFFLLVGVGGSISLFQLMGVDSKIIIRSVYSILFIIVCLFSR